MFSNLYVVSLECLVRFQTSSGGGRFRFGSIKHSCFLGGSYHLGSNQTRSSAVTGAQVLPTELTFPAGRRLVSSMHTLPHEVISAWKNGIGGGKQNALLPLCHGPLGPCSIWRIRFPPSCCPECKNSNLTHGQTSHIVGSLEGNSRFPPS